MLLTILIYSGIIALVLLVLYLVARFVPILGDALAFICVLLARILVTLQGMLERAGNCCYEVFEKSLRYPADVTSDAWHGVLVIAKNIILAVSSIILTADIYNMLQRLPLLFGGAGAVDLPGSFAIPSSLLFVCMTALYGAVVLECVELLPYGAGLFPKMTEKVKKWLGITCAIGLGLSFVFAVLFWVTSGYYISVDPSTPAWLSIPALALVGIILSGASVLALWGLVVGLTGLCSVVFWLLSFGFHSAAAITSFVPELLNVLSMDFTQGKRSVRGELGGHDPVNPPASPFPQTRQILPGQTSTALVPQTASSIVDADVEVVPVETTVLEETTTMNPDKNAFIGFVGEFGSRMFPHVGQAIERLHADSIYASYYLERSRTHVQTKLKDIHDLSHPVAEKNLSMLHGATEDEGNHTLLCDLSHKIAEAYHPLIAIPAPFAHFIDCNDLVNSIDLLESNKRRNPLISQVVITSVSELASHNKGVQTGIADLVALQQEGFIDSVIVVNPRSQFAAQHGEDTQLRFLAQFVISLIIAHKHDPHNLSFSSVFKQFSSISPFTTVSFASQVVAVGSMPKRWSWLPLSTGSSGTGYYADILSQAREATDRVLLEEDTRAFPAHVRSDTAGCMVIYNVPIELRDRRFAELVRDNSLYVASRYPFVASTSTVRANGCGYPHSIGGRFLVQASCIYPLQPASLQRMYEGRTTKITPLYPVTTTLEPTGSNGHVSAQKQTNKTTSAKAVASTRQKKAAGSTPRVVRKNTKQAK